MVHDFGVGWLVYRVYSTDWKRAYSRTYGQHRRRSRSRRATRACPLIRDVDRLLLAKCIVSANGKRGRLIANGGGERPRNQIRGGVEGEDRVYVDVNEGDAYGSRARTPP